MGIIYTAERHFTAEQLQKLFLSVDWLSGNYPEKLLKALNNSETVFTAWDDDTLVGLINAIDDGELTAYVHYLLVSPDYQGKNVGSTLVDMVKEKYSDYLYLFLVAEAPPLIDYYRRLGFEHLESRSVMAISKP